MLNLLLKKKHKRPKIYNKTKKRNRGNLLKRGKNGKNQEEKEKKD